MNTTSQSVGISILAGGLAGASETFVTYPAEFVKTRRQLDPSCTGRKPPSSFVILRSTTQESGFRGIYAGCQTLAISNAFKSGVRFFSFEITKRNLTPYFASPTSSDAAGARNPWLNLASGLCAGATESVLVVTPGEALKTRIIHDAASGGVLGRLSTRQLVAHTVRQEGMFSLWRGLTPVLCKQGTNSAVRFTTFSALRDKLRDTWPERLSGATATMIAGAGSGAVTVYASMPFDNIKTRMQSIGSHGKNMASVATSMLIKEGVFVFWKATTPRLVRLTLSSSITFIVYDSALNMFDLLATRPTKTLGI